jgi:hypothetical protein
MWSGFIWLRTATSGVLVGTGNRGFHVQYNVDVEHKQEKQKLKWDGKGNERRHDC